MAEPGLRCSACRLRFAPRGPAASSPTPSVAGGLADLSEGPGEGGAPLPGAGGSRMRDEACPRTAELFDGELDPEIGAVVTVVEHPGRPGEGPAPKSFSG